MLQTSGTDNGVLWVDVASAATADAGLEQRQLRFVGDDAGQCNDLGRRVRFSQNGNALGAVEPRQVAVQKQNLRHDSHQAFSERIESAYRQDDVNALQALLPAGERIR